MSPTTFCAHATSRTDGPHAPYPLYGSLPVDFDHAAHPIIARHFFGVEPFHPIGEVASEVVAEAK